jgi:hypothetical protein
MNKFLLRSALPALPALAAAVFLLAGCQQDAPPPDEAVPEIIPEATTAPDTTPAAATTPVTVATVELGKAVDGSGMVIEPTLIFATTDKIHASVTTMTSEPGATVAGKLAARWTDPSGHVVGEPMAKDFKFTGPGVTTFTLASEKPWQAGNYRVEIMLDNVMVATRDFAVVR